jgi:hypothetical protein
MSSHLRLGTFTSGFPNKTLYAFLHGAKQCINFIWFGFMLDVPLILFSFTVNTRTSFITILLFHL